MRSVSSTVLCAALLVSLAPAAASASAPAGQDWRVAACTDGGRLEVPLSGARTVTREDVTPVAGFDDVRIHFDRLESSDEACDLLYIAGALPRGSALKAVRNQLCTVFDVALDGVHQGRSSSCAALAGRTALHDDPTGYDGPRDLTVLAVETYRPRESEVLEAEPGMPAEMVGATHTSTYAGSTWSVVLRGTTLVRRAFDRTSATDRKARAAHDRRLDRAVRQHAERAEEIRATRRSEAWKEQRLEAAAATRRDAVLLARQQLRLALVGVRLVAQEVGGRYSGSTY